MKTIRIEISAREILSIRKKDISYKSKDTLISGFMAFVNSKRKQDFILHKIIDYSNILKNDTKRKFHFCDFHIETIDHRHHRRHLHRSGYSVLIHFQLQQQTRNQDMAE